MWGWIDGTLRPICRPSTVNQEPLYSSYKKLHASKYQDIMTSKGIMSSLASLVEGSVGDWMLWYLSGIEDFLCSLFLEIPASEHMYLYGDPVYYGRFGIIRAYCSKSSSSLSDSQQAFNVEMSRLRISVKHGFVLCLQLWSFNSYRCGLQYGKSPVAVFYLIFILLTNMYTCLRGNLISQRFQCSPPSLSVYLAPE